MKQETYSGNHIKAVEQAGIAHHAVVIGASMAGLLAARVLAEHFERVTLVERDQLPAAPEARQGIPQARHIHILLVRGQRILTHLFPGLEAELAAAGAPVIDWQRDAAMLLPTGWVPQQQAGDLVTYACSRDCLEWLVRRRLTTQHNNVHFLAGYQVMGLLEAAGQRRVTGVKLRPHRLEGGSQAVQASLEATLVVDASGRQSRLPQWLQEMGYAPPQETIINASLGYASRLYQPPPGWQADWKALLISARPPDFPRGAAILPQENGQWVVTAAGTAADYPPTDEAGFVAFMRSLPSPIVYEAISAAQPLSPIYGYRGTENRLRHYEQMASRPEGIVALGDAVCAFNPVYGQGMTVAALAALTLDACLSRQQPSRGLDDLAKRFYKQLAHINRTPWLLATAEDFRWPQTQGGKRTWMTRLMHRYMEQVLALVPHDSRVSRRFFEVTHLVASPAALLHPAILALILPRLLGTAAGARRLMPASLRRLVSQ